MNINLPASTAGLASTTFVTGVSGALNAKINASAAGVSTLNTLSGNLTLQGTGSVAISIAGQTILISGTSTGGAGGGGITQAQLDSLSGYTNSALSGVSGDGRAIQFVTQANHLFSGGNVVANYAGAWTGAYATVSSPAIGVVETSGTTSTFSVVTAGLINLKNNQFAANTAYYVSDTATGYLTSTAPTGYNSYYLPVLYTVSATQGYVIPTWAASLASIQNSSLAAMAVGTIKCNPTSLSAPPIDSYLSGAGTVTLSYSQSTNTWFLSGQGSSGVMVTGSSAVSSPNIIANGGLAVTLSGNSTIVVSGGGGLTNTQVTGSVNLANLNISGQGNITTLLQGNTLLISATNGGSTTGSNVTVTGSATLLTANLVGAGGVTVTTLGTNVTISGAASPVFFNVQTGTYYTPAISDQYNQICMSGNNTQYVVLPTGSGFTTGAQIVVEQYGTGQVYFMPTGGITLQSRGGVSGFGGQFAQAALTMYTLTTWKLAGDIL